MKFLLSLFTAVLAAPAQKTSPSGLIPLCNDPSLVACAAPFEAQKYLGTWYEQGRSFIIRKTFESNNNCVRAIYSLNADGTVKVNNGAIDATSGAYLNIIGSAKIASPGVLQVAFGDKTVGGQIGAFFQGLAGPNYYVKQIWADAQGNYKKVLVAYGKNLPGFAQFEWVLSRDEIISDAELQDALAYGKLAGFDSEKNGFKRSPCTDAQRAVLNANL
jgi:apolipoprotein D and lipocalin family protein